MLNSARTARTANHLLQYMNLKRVSMVCTRLGSCSYVCRSYVRRRLAFVGILVLLISKTLFKLLTVVSIDSALMLWVVPAKSAFTIWTSRQPSLSRKLQR